MTSYGRMTKGSQNIEFLTFVYSTHVLHHLLDRLAQKLEVTFTVHARPGVAKTELKEVLGDGSLKINVAAKPEGGKANAELIKFLAGELGVPKSNIEIVMGRTARQKIIRISTP